MQDAARNRQEEGGPSRWWSTLARSILCGSAVLLGVSSLLCAASGDVAVWASPLFLDAGTWNVLCGSSWLLLAVHAALPLRRGLRVLLCTSLGLICVASVLDTHDYYQLVERGAIRTARALPSSLFVALLALGGLAEGWVGRGAPRGWRQWALGLAGGGAGLVAATLVLLMTFAATDYRRPADCAVVLGAGVHADGSPSLALSDRVAEGVQLYKARHVERLVMSGGIDPRHGRSEPRVMRRLAMESGVPAANIELDEHGDNTRASAVNCAKILEQHGWEDALLVSNGYHLLRAKTAFRREGVRVYTVPATETRKLAREPYFVLRECIAWLYYALPS